MRVAWCIISLLISSHVVTPLQIPVDSIVQRDDGSETSREIPNGSVSLLETTAAHQVPVGTITTSILGALSVIVYLILGGAEPTALTDIKPAPPILPIPKGPSAGGSGGSGCTKARILEKINEKIKQQVPDLTDPSTLALAFPEVPETIADAQSIDAVSCPATKPFIPTKKFAVKCNSAEDIDINLSPCLPSVDAQESHPISPSLPKVGGACLREDITAKIVSEIRKSYPDGTLGSMDVPESIPLGESFNTIKCPSPPSNRLGRLYVLVTCHALDNIAVDASACLVSQKSASIHKHGHHGSLADGLTVPPRSRIGSVDSLVDRDRESSKIEPLSRPESQESVTVQHSDPNSIGVSSPIKHEPKEEVEGCPEPVLESAIRVAVDARLKLESDRYLAFSYAISDPAYRIPLPVGKHMVACPQPFKTFATSIAEIECSKRVDGGYRVNVDLSRCYPPMENALSADDEIRRQGAVCPAAAVTAKIREAVRRRLSARKKTFPEEDHTHQPVDIGREIQGKDGQVEFDCPTPPFAEKQPIKQKFAVTCLLPGLLIIEIGSCLFHI